MRLILPVIIIVMGIGVVLAPSFLQNKGLTISQGSNRLQELAQATKVTIEQKRDDLLLPDLKLTPPKNLYIQNKLGKRYIRFDTTFSNIGKGPLVLIGETNSDKTATIAKQFVRKKDGGTEEREVGSFIYHPGHDHLHWHLEKYSQFQLLSINERGEPQDILAQTDKLSFCIWDEHTVDLSVENASQSRVYTRCPKNNIQGISVGWGDTYKSGVEGQELDITDILDGTYAARSTVNVEQKILESDYSNNFVINYIRLKGSTLKVIDLADINQP